MHSGSRDGVMKNLEVDAACGTQGGQWVRATWNNQNGGAWRTGALVGTRRTAWDAGLGEWGQDVQGEPEGEVVKSGRILTLLAAVANSSKRSEGRKEGRAYLGSQL